MPRAVSAAIASPTLRRIVGSIATSQRQIRRHSTRTQAVMIVLTMNMIGRKITMTKESSITPNIWLVRKVRTL